MNKKLLSLSAVGLLFLAACGNSQANLPQQQSSAKQEQSAKKITLSTFALNQDIVERDIITPFKTAQAVDVVLEVGNATERLTKVKNNQGHIDVIELSQANATQGYAEQLFEPLTAEQIPNIAQLTDGAKEVFEKGGGVPYSMNSIGIIYNKEKLGHDITEWSDLWSEDLVGKIAIPDISTTAGPLFLSVVAQEAQTSLQDGKNDEVFKRLEVLKPNIVKTYTKSSDLANMFQAGEIEVAVVADFAVKTTQKAEPNAMYIVPASGTYANYNTINVVASSGNKTEAYAFVNHRISQENQVLKASSKSLSEAPINKQVQLTVEESKNMTYGDIAKRAKTVDFTIVNKNLGTWIEQWNRILNQ